ncbi:YgfZ/GcvT domain-containing protein [Falsirhodobacter halotolerans]|uniref:CAF17-like 4Fe-4S cluster assembly/insertion protein YgfZ n=1 Tax=Falsirhodobacter halotolerans TaxID=1146892 RepID=UPI001FD5BBCF|nr:folate-binding protein [Falsirhodobacter halotolerans]MCJ8139442.1 folate-binding protein [Falsirhodobacter halotolerans]
MTERTLWTLTGADRLDFLQNLVTNDVAALTEDGIVWTGFLTPQGKYLADFFVIRTGDDLLIDIPTPIAAATLQRLNMYRLRADVAIAPAQRQVTRGLGTPPPGAFADPRHPALGWRGYEGQTPEEGVDWDALRVEHLIPESGTELGPDTFILEMGFERLHGVDFRKGCYVGQEVTARMKHKTELKKGLVRVTVDGPSDTGSDITADGRAAGRLFTRSGHRALAYLRFDRADGGLQAGEARIEFDTR